MNPHPLTVKVVTEASNLLQNLGFGSTIFIHLQSEIEESVQDQNGMVTHLGSYPTSNVSHIRLKLRYFTPRHISQLLHHFISETQLCHILGQKIALDCALLHPPFLISVQVKLIRQVRIMLPPSVTVPSRAASDDVLQRLVDEQRVESIDLEEEEEATCSICMENLTESNHDKIIRMPTCLHLFHQGCIFEWLKLQNSCPLCRRVPYEDDDDEAVTETPRLA